MLACIKRNMKGLTLEVTGLARLYAQVRLTEGLAASDFAYLLGTLISFLQECKNIILYLAILLKKFCFLFSLF